MTKKEFDQERREKDREAMNADPDGFKRAVLRRIGELETKMFCVGHFVGTDYRAVRRGKKMTAEIRKRCAEMEANAAEMRRKREGIGKPR